MNALKLTVAAALPALLLGAAPQPPSSHGIHPRNLKTSGTSPTTGVIIDNGMVQLGINPEGHLNVAGGVMSSGCFGTTDVGLRYLPTVGEATAPGCLCEGWGAADAGLGVFGTASVDNGQGTQNLTVESFTSTASTATSVVRVLGALRVTHDYQPSPYTPYLYECQVTIENIYGATLTDVRYTRAMDWDIPPNTFDEYSTIQGSIASANVLFASDNGFSDPNPLLVHYPILEDWDFVDLGPEDHGAMFDFGFGPLLAGESLSFSIYYGAAGNETDALAALVAVGAEVFSLGQASWDGTGDPLGCDTSYQGNGGTYGPTTGEPATFIFAFAGVGGYPALATLTPEVAHNLPDTNHTVELAIQDFLGGPVPNIQTTFDIISGPNAGLTGGGITDANGISTFTYTGTGGIGVDEIAGHFINPINGAAIPTNTALKFWDLDCNTNGIPDTCDIDCDGYGTRCALFTGCGGSQDVNGDGVPDDCNSEPVCDIRGPYSAECGGAVTRIQLDGTFSFDPDPNDPLEFQWSACAGAWYDDPTVPMPWLNIPTGGACSAQCSVTLRVSDASGSFAECSTTVDVTDTTAPTWTSAPASEDIECDAGNIAAAIQAWLDSAAADDLCGNGATVTNDYAGLSGGCGGATGSATVTFTAADGCGNSRQHMATIAVVDTTPPSIDVPPTSPTVDCDGSGNPAALNNWLSTHGGAVASDACGSVTWSNDYDPSHFVGGCGETGSVTVVFTATDECGLSTDAPAATFSIVDNTDPTIDTPPGDLTVECDGAGNLAELNQWLATQGGGTASDACGGVSWTNDYQPQNFQPGCGATGSVDVVFTAVDACGNETAAAAVTFSIVDTTAPAINPAASDLTVEIDPVANPGQLSAWLAARGGASASDACGAVTWTNNYDPINFVPGCGGGGTVNVTFTATDECGNSSPTSANFTITDTTAPTLVTPASNLEVECDGSGNTTQLNAWLANNGGATATDPSGPLTWSNDYDPSHFIGGCGATGSVTVVFTVRDDCDNSTSTSGTFIIEDTTAPTIDTPAGDLTVQCDGTGNTSDLNDWLATAGGASASDACGGVSWSNNFTALSDDCGETGSATVTFTATDACGNDTTTTATFTIIDDQPPVFTAMPPDAIFPKGELVGSLLAWLNSAEAVDVCSGPTTVTHDAPPGGFPMGSSTVVTWTAVDDCGNVATYSATIRIIPPERAQTGTKGSLLIYPDIEVRYDGPDPQTANVIQDTFIFLCNDYPAPVEVHMYMINGDSCAHIDNHFTLTQNQPAYWSAATAEPGPSGFNLSKFTQAGAPIPDPEGTTDYVVRGHVLVHAVNPQGNEIRWNHLWGTAAVTHYVDGTVYEYSTWAFPVMPIVNHGEEPLDCLNFDVNGTCLDAAVIPGRIDLDGYQYAISPDKLMLSFMASGSQGFSRPGYTTLHDTDLVLVALNRDLRATAPGPELATQLDAVVYNENELAFTGTTRCVGCWDAKLFSLWGSPFTKTALQTDKGYVILDGVGDPICDVWEQPFPGAPPVQVVDSIDMALLGVAAHLVDITGGPVPDKGKAGAALRVTGREASSILYDVLSGGGGEKVGEDGGSPAVPAPEREALQPEPVTP
jgi:hypothetical protein